MSIEPLRSEREAMSSNPIPRTTDQVVARILELEAAKTDQFGIERSRLLEALPLEQAKRWLHADNPPDAAAWEASRLKTREQVLGRAAAELVQAWRWANMRRHQSVAKVLAHFRGCFWLLGLDDAYAAIEQEQDKPLEYFGKRELVAVATALGADWHKLDDDQWVEVRLDAEPLVVTAAEAMGT